MYAGLALLLLSTLALGREGEGEGEEGREAELDGEKNWPAGVRIDGCTVRRTSPLGCGQMDGDADGDGDGDAA